MAAIARVGVGRAHESGLEHSGQMDVVEIAAAAGDEVGILDARHRRSEISNAHIGLLFWTAALPCIWSVVVGPTRLTASFKNRTGRSKRKRGKAWNELRRQRHVDGGAYRRGPRSRRPSLAADRPPCLRSGAACARRAVSRDPDQSAGVSRLAADRRLRWTHMWRRSLDGFTEFSVGDDAVLLGNGFGGTVALAFALAHPKRIGKLVLCDAAACFPEPGKQAFRVMSRESRGRRPRHHCRHRRQAGLLSRLSRRPSAGNRRTPRRSAGDRSGRIPGGLRVAGGCRPGTGAGAARGSDPRRLRRTRSGDAAGVQQTDRRADSARALCRTSDMRTLSAVRAAAGLSRCGPRFHPSFERFRSVRQ